VFGFGPATRIYVAAGATDMRKNFNGLYGLVRDHLGCDPESGHVFLFANARRYRTTFGIQIAFIHCGVCLAPATWKAGTLGPKH
jgi:transposase